MIVHQDGSTHEWVTDNSFATKPDSSIC